jgi:cell cycle sensor histidine kinase DivJ
MEIVGLAEPIRDYVDALVHPAAAHDALSAARHRAFIAPRLLGSLIALAAFPIYITLRGAPSALEVLIFAWLMAPILIAYYLSRTGQYDHAHILSALALTALGTIVATASGGIGSFATVWLVIVPLEAALSAAPRVVAFASALSIGAAGLLVLLGAGEMLPLPQSPALALAVLGIISACLYATTLALGAQSLLRTGFRLHKDQTDRYRLLAGYMTDAITRHDRNGAILFASPAAESLFGTQTRDLIGHGLFDRVHVADRPAFLTTLADAAVFGQARSVEFRARRDSIEPARGVQFIWVAMSCHPLARASGNVGDRDREVIAVMRDISERKRQEQAIGDMADQLEQANAAQSKLLAIVSHEQAQTIQRLSSASDIRVKKSA